ncbi:Malonyl CoA-acyl carrier protein transacylase [Cystobacter fuscus DSM 2262]|uniref:Malonyl CoA-acyl carrier protein transacylase n=1 Tax=Cystobacter fuscus (strain ATCC 25194 / DSM 2262 / NBRC 100088 / M29) TaxID=1242864 RepID=S9NTE9_CYSF2|nr:type I polyketide synthase [Cystobacter fuscus]EPX55415.1 Malonyl CoA-acyl carrier protein transacylase [Cystobacter fuscus DSM 2262]
MSEEINYRQLLQQQLVKIRKLEARLEQAEAARREPIAIVGMGCRLPGGVEGPEDFWELMVRGVDATSEVPPDRWDAEALFGTEPGKIATRRGGFLKDVERFDARFFGISDREAERMDPQQRLVLEVAWEALERAGHAVDRARRERVGVFVGVMNNDYGQRVLDQEGLAGIDPTFMGARANCAISGRLSYLWGFQGPSLVVDTACSSSLVAVHLACQSLRNGECNVALAGGVNLLLSPEVSVYLSSSGALSPDGRCKSFDASADGFGRAEACGVLALERLSDARARGAPILAIIRGSAVGHDGPSSAFSVPNGVAQQGVIRQALQHAGVAPVEVSYLEAHGTGTAMGDPIEVEAMWSVLKEGRKGGESLWMGSVKTNVGYPEAASGVVGMMKVVLAMRHGQLPTHLHLKTPNPRIDWASMAVKVPGELTAWTPTQGARIAGVTSYGRTGTLAHVVLAEPPPRVEPERRPERPGHVLVLSARSEEALRAQVERYARFLAMSTEPLGDVCFTAAVGRTHFEHRLAVVGRDARQVRERLLEARGGSKVMPGALAPDVTFVFGGEGAAGGRELYDTQPAFREGLEACAAAVKDVLGEPLVGLMYGEGSGRWKDASQERIAVFARQWALARMWRAWGVRPSAVAGEGVGEWVAAVEAGVLGLEAGLRRAAGETGPAVNWASAVLPRVTRASDVGVRLDVGRADSAEWTQVLETLGALYVRGVEVDWAAFDAPHSRRRIALPTYPFQRQRYWLTPDVPQ